MRPDHIGDVLLSSAAVQLIRDALPAAHLTYLVGPWAAEAARRGPAVNEVRTLRFPGFSRAAIKNVLQPYALLARWAVALRRERYDLAVVLRPDHWWGALLALAAGVPLRVGGLTQETQPLLSHAREAGPNEHWAEQALGIARLALSASRVQPSDGVQPSDTAEHQVVFRLSDEARAEAAAWWQANALNGKRVVAIHPNAGAELKSWPADRWAALGAGLEAQVLLSGAPGDEDLLQCIQQHLGTRAVVACGQRLEVSAALFERCALVIAPDSGAAHLAGAVGTPTVRLYGPASAQVFGPWPPRSDQVVLTANSLACVPCGHMARPPCGAERQPACMLALGVDEVIGAAKHLLGEG